MLAEYYEQQDSSGENILIFYCSEMKNHVRRVEGFTGRLRQSGKYRFRLIHFPLIKTKDYASRLARLLHSIHEQFPFDCIFSPDGYTPYVCGAIKKLGKEGQICCVGLRRRSCERAIRRRSDPVGGCEAEYRGAGKTGGGNRKKLLYVRPAAGSA